MKKPSWPSAVSLKSINAVLLVVILLTNSYVLLAPLLPRLDYEVKQRITKPVQVDPSNSKSVNNIDRSRNHLILPSLQLDEPVYDGTSPSMIDKGIWRRPNTSTPERGGNTVLVGHRFIYAGTAVFYNLDKLQISDDVYLVYGQKIYHYKITSSSVVPPTAVEVEAPSSETKLTLYTCTPLLTAKDRLVIVAELKEVL